MYLKFTILLISIWNIDCHISKRQSKNIELQKTSKSKKVDEVTPARYAVKSGVNYDPIDLPVAIDGFPQMEFPGSIIDSNPFYLSTSPFSDDVKSSFQSLVAEGNKAKPKPNPLTNNENQSIRNKEKLSISSKKIGEKEVLITVKKGINNRNNNTTNQMEAQDHYTHDFNNTTEEEYVLLEKSNLKPAATKIIDEIEYVTEIIDELDKFLTNITDIETVEASILAPDVLIPTPNPDKNVSIKSQAMFDEPVTASDLSSSKNISSVNSSLIDDMQGHYCSVAAIEPIICEEK